MKGDKQLYQFGDARNNSLTFNKEDFSSTLNPAVKRVTRSSNLYDGVSRINVNNQNNKEEYVLDIDFLFDNDNSWNYGLDHLNTVLYSEPKPIFFYSVNTDVQNPNQNITWYYNIAECITPPKQIIEQSEGKGTEKQIIPLSFAMSPYYYECDNSLAYYDSELFSINQVTYNGGVTYNSGTVYDSAPTFGFVGLSGLTVDQQISLFVTPNKPRSQLVYTDRFFKKEGLDIDSSNLSINTTLVNNSLNSLVTSPTYSKTSANNRIYLIKLGQLTQDDTITINNLDTDTGLYIKWLDTTSSPLNLIYNSFWNHLYDPTTGNIITTNQALILPSLNNWLYFGKKYSINPLLTTKTENITLQKNTSSNLTVSCEILNTYH